MRDEKKQLAQSIFKYSGIGIQFAIIILLFIYGGYLLDKHYDKSPLFILTGSFLGLGLGSYYMIRSLIAIGKEDTESEVDEEDDRTKWM